VTGRVIRSIVGAIGLIAAFLAAAIILRGTAQAQTTTTAPSIDELEKQLEKKESGQKKAAAQKDTRKSAPPAVLPANPKEMPSAAYEI
jgi:hypothetical protein